MTAQEFKQRFEEFVGELNGDIDLFGFVADRGGENRAYFMAGRQVDLKLHLAECALDDADFRTALVEAAKLIEEPQKEKL